MNHAARTQSAADDVAGLDNAAPLTITSFAWWRPDLPRAVAEDYWRDVHGAMAARVPGLWQYRQFRLGASRAGLWPSVPGVSFEASPQEQPQGMPHLLFRDQREQAAFSANPVITKLIPADGRNFVARDILQISPPGAARTLLDLVGEPRVQGAPKAPSFAVCFRARPGVDVAEVHRYLGDELGPAWAGHPAARRVRVVPLEPHDPAGWDSPGVANQWPGGREYAGWVELAVAADSTAADGALRELAAAVDGTRLAALVEAVHTYPVTGVFTIVQAGRPTDVGLRGYHTAAVIAAAGATEQNGDPELLELVYGAAVHGIGRLDPR